MIMSRHMQLAVRHQISSRLSSLRAPCSPCQNTAARLASSERPSSLQVSRRFSDRLVGYSPMSPSASAPSSNAKMPTAQDVSTSGGVWAPTSAKRDKLGELRAALDAGQKTLDDAATPEQKLDLYLADGIHAIARAADETNEASVAHELQAWMDERGKDLPDDLHQVQWGTYLAEVSHKAVSMAAKYPPQRCLRNVRDFFEILDRDQVEGIEKSDVDGNLDSVAEAVGTNVTRHRWVLVQAAADHLKESWDALATVTDADVDRSAVDDRTLDAQASTLPLHQLNEVLRTFAGGSCSDRVSAVWNLMDRDGDGMLDQVEMDKVAYLVVHPTQNAVHTLFEDAVKAIPIRTPLQEIDAGKSLPIPKKGWRERRKEQRAEKRLLRLFQIAKRRHFEDEVEMPHRLRCIYAWADKAHQNNKTDSIQVDTAFGGRTRYVELEPKISRDEFYEVQKEHFPHLDRIGQEVIRSFREDVLVDQGKGRQNRELRRDCFLFLSVVSVLDFIIVSL